MRITSKFARLDLMDLAKGFLMATIAPFVVGVQQVWVGNYEIVDYKLLGLTALGSGIGYLIKNFFTQSQEVSARRQAIGGGGIMNPK